MKNRVLLFLVVLCLVIAGGWYWLRGKDFTVRISQRQVDEALAERFPMQRTHLMIFDLTYENPVAELLEGEDRVRVGMDARLTIGLGGERRTFSGGATVTTSVRYEPETFSFFLSDVEMERLAIDGIPSQYTDPAGRLALLAARESIEEIRVYQIQGVDAKTRAAKMILKNIQVKDQSIRITLGL